MPYILILAGTCFPVNISPKMLNLPFKVWVLSALHHKNRTWFPVSSLTLLKSQNQVLQEDVCGLHLSWMNNIIICVAPLSLLGEVVGVDLYTLRSFTTCSGSLWEPCAKCQGRPGNRDDPPPSSPPHCDWPDCSDCAMTPLQAECPGRHKRSVRGPEGDMRHKGGAEKFSCAAEGLL